MRHGTIATLCLLTVMALTMSIKSYNAEQQAQQKRLAAENLLGFMVGEFADKLRSIGRMDLLDGISNKALEYFTDFNNSSTLQSTEAMLQHGQTLTAMGEVAYSRGKTDEASAALQSGRSQLEAVLKLQPTNLELLKTLGANAFWLGQIQYDASNWQGTQPEFERYYHYSEQMYELAPDNLDAIMELSYATNSLGSLAMKQQQFAVARKNFEESLKLKLLAQAKQPENNQLLADIADTRSWLASATISEGNLLSAISIHKALQHDLVLAEVKEPYLLEVLSSSYQILADFLSYQGNANDSQTFYLEGYRALAKAIEQDPENSRWQRRKLHLDINALAFLVSNDVNAIQQHIEKIQESLSSAQVVLSDAQLQELFARLWLTGGMKLQQLQQWALSQNYIDLAVSGYSELNQRAPQNQSYYVALVESQLFKAKALSILDEHEQAITICKSIKDRLADTIKNNKEPRHLISYTKALDCLNELNEHPTLTTLLQQNGVTNFNF